MKQPMDNIEEDTINILILKHYASKINLSHFYLPSSAKEKDNNYPENI